MSEQGRRGGATPLAYSGLGLVFTEKNCSILLKCFVGLLCALLMQIHRQPDFQK